jgi:WD40 repeat protein
VNDLCWSGNDFTLTTVGGDGGVYTWDIQTQRRVHEAVAMHTSFCGVVVDAASDRIAVVGVERTALIVGAAADSDEAAFDGLCMVRDASHLSFVTLVYTHKHTHKQHTLSSRPN